MYYDLTPAAPASLSDFCENFDALLPANFLTAVRTLSRVTEAAVETGISRGYTMYNIITSSIIIIILRVPIL